MIDHRLDTRTFGEFAENLQRHTTKEFQYMLDWLSLHNQNRHKRDYGILPWGCDKQVYRKAQYAKHLYRPDFLLCRFYENSYVIKDIFPIEITTCTNIPEDIYLKQSKVQWEYDTLTPTIASTPPYILFILNTKEEGEERYNLLTPKFIRKLTQNQKPKKAQCFGWKQTYSFKATRRTWRPLYSNNHPLLPFKEEDKIYVVHSLN